MIACIFVLTGGIGGQIQGKGLSGGAGGCSILRDGGGGGGGSRGRNRDREGETSDTTGAAKWKTGYKTTKSQACRRRSVMDKTHVSSYIAGG